MAAALLSACDTVDLVGPVRVELAMVATNSGGVTGFYWLPPLVAAPTVSGAFDGSHLNDLTVSICALSGAGCGATVATLSSAGAGSERLRIENDGQPHYHVNWHAKRTAAPGVYRARVLLDGDEIGFVDIEVGKNGAAVPLKFIITNELEPKPVAGWSTKAPMPTARHGAFAGAVNGIVYVIGGYNLSVNEAYDPATNTWSVRAPMPTPRNGDAQHTAVVDGIIYAIGGQLGGSCLNVVEAYNPATNTWSARAPMPTARCTLTVTAHNGLIYAIGGGSAGGFDYAVVQVYDPATNSWSNAPSLLDARQDAAAIELDGRIYVVGGLRNQPFQLYATTFAFDAVAQSWSARANMSVARVDPSAAALGGLLYAVGGSNFSGVLSSMEAYDPATDTWSAQLPMPTARRSAMSAVVNGVLYVIGGTNNLQELSVVEAYTN
jgi:N-acetylneuraminic acid mutarotase